MRFKKLLTPKPPSNASARQFSVSAWEDRLSELAEYRKIRGHCNVPQRCSEYTKLSNWVAYQKRQYKVHLLEEKTSHSTPSRIQGLERLGFDWGGSVPQPGKTVRASLPTIALFRGTAMFLKTIAKTPSWLIGSHTKSVDTGCTYSRRKAIASDALPYSGTGKHRSEWDCSVPPGKTDWASFPTIGWSGGTAILLQTTVLVQPLKDLYAGRETNSSGTAKEIARICLSLATTVESGECGDRVYPQKCKILTP